jgi:hypothetical protein
LYTQIAAFIFAPQLQISINQNYYHATNQCNSKAFFSAGNIVRKCFTVLTLGLLLTACSKDNDDNENPSNPSNPNGPGNTEESYYASKLKMKLAYKTTDADGPESHTLTVQSQKDSAGGKVIAYGINYSDGSNYGSSIFIKGNTATFMNTLPAELADMVTAMQNDPDVSDFVLTGVPMHQKMPVNPQVGQAIEFSEPMYLGWTMMYEGEAFRVDIRMALTEGKVVGFEDVTTEAGTFKNCVKWQYKSTLTTEMPTDVQVTETQNTIWFAKGIGLVKSTETEDGVTTTTLLTSVAGK